MGNRESTNSTGEGKRPTEGEKHKKRGGVKRFWASETRSLPKAERPKTPVEMVADIGVYGAGKGSDSQTTEAKRTTEEQKTLEDAIREYSWHNNHMSYYNTSLTTTDRRKLQTLAYTCQNLYFQRETNFQAEYVSKYEKAVNEYLKYAEDSRLD